MDILDTAYAYFPFPMPSNWHDGATTFMYDKPKLNLLWLVFPDVDALHELNWSGNVVTESINRHLDKESHAYLQGPPNGFLQYWLALNDRFSPSIASSWPADYLDTMTRRVAQVNARLRADLPDKAILVDFKRRERVA